MQTLAVIGFALLLVLLIGVASIRLRRSSLSRFELERRRAAGDHTAAEELDRELVLDDVASLQRALVAALLVLTVLSAVAVFGWMLGTIVAVVIALGYGRLTQFDKVAHPFTNIYQRYDDQVSTFVRSHPTVGKLLRSVTYEQREVAVNSREELEHMIEQSSHILTSNEKKLLLSGLAFPSKTVDTVMTPHGVVDTIAKNELIGPLTLNDLHKTGHSRFPVIDGDIDHVVGVLHIRELLTLGDKQSQTAGEAMEKHVYYIHQDQTLYQALAAFLKTRHHLFVVVNGYRETAGILTLEDVVEALIGRTIVDEFDVHDDLRSVATREAQHNNRPPHSSDV